MTRDPLGDRMKLYERVEAGRVLMPLLPVIVRLDGKSFSKWTSGLRRPYDERLSRIFVDVTKRLVEESNARIGYTQSDEITLVLYSDTYRSEIFFGGKVAKLNSVLASMATAHFNSLVSETIPEKKHQIALFDCRCWNVPNETEASNAVLWRELDATKNSISMATRHYYSHKDMHGKSSRDMQDMLWKKGVNWNDYPSFFKRGVFIQRRTENRVLSPEELISLPEKHTARKNPGLPIPRSVIRELSMPPFAKVTNREGVIFRGEEPLTS